MLIHGACKAFGSGSLIASKGRIVLALVAFITLSCTHTPSTASPSLGISRAASTSLTRSPGEHGWRAWQAATEIENLRLRGGRSLEEADKKSEESGKGRKLPDVGEAMKAKILKHRQMRKARIPTDKEEAKTKIERRKQHEERRQRKDAQRATRKKLLIKERKRRPFILKSEREAANKKRQKMENEPHAAKLVNPLHEGTRGEGTRGDNHTLQKARGAQQSTDTSEKGGGASIGTQFAFFTSKKSTNTATSPSFSTRAQSAREPGVNRCIGKGSASARSTPNTLTGCC